MPSTPFSRRLSLPDSLHYLNTHEAYVAYFPNFLGPDEAAHYYRELLKQITFDSAEASAVRVPFRATKVPIPRLQTAYGDTGTSYGFADCRVAARPWIPLLQELRELLQARTGYATNFVLINYYRSGTDMIGWHADDEKDLGPAPTILSLSLGAERDFQLRHRDTFPRPGKAASETALQTITIALQSGSVLLM